MAMAVKVIGAEGIGYPVLRPAAQGHLQMIVKWRSFQHRHFTAHSFIKRYGGIPWLIALRIEDTDLFFCAMCNPRRQLVLGNHDLPLAMPGSASTNHLKKKLVTRRVPSTAKEENSARCK